MQVVAEDSGGHLGLVIEGAAEVAWELQVRRGAILPEEKEAALDAYRRYVVHWKLLVTMRAADVRMVIHDAVKKTGANPLRVLQGGQMKKFFLKGFAGAKVMGYLLRHPVTGTRNLLARRGARSLLKENRKAIATAGALITTAVAAPVVVRTLRKDADSEG